jgi:uncharacterized protein YbjQ (UPF0145 family)
MVTAGLSSQLSHNFHLTGSNLTLAQQFQQKALNGLVSATVSTAIEGGNFDDKLKAVLKTATLDTLNQLGAQKVGDLLGSGQYGYLAHKIAHTALGCAVGAATNDDCESAAIGGLVGSIAGDHYNSEQAATLTAAIAATLLGKDVNLAANVGTIADKFNRQLHQVEIDLLKDKAKEFAEKLNISEEEALARLTQQALRNVDLQWALKLAGLPKDAAAVEFLQTLANSGTGTFTDESGIQRTTFTQDSDYLRSGIYADHAKQNAAFLSSVIPADIRTKKIGGEELKAYLTQGSDEAKQVLQAIIDDPLSFIDGLQQQVTQAYEKALATAPDELARQAIEDGYQTALRDLNGLLHDQQTGWNGIYDWLGLEGIYGDSEANEVAAILAIAAAVNTVTDYTGIKGVGKGITKEATIRNGHLAGGVHPKTGVPFDNDGFPDFSDFSIEEVKIQMSGNRRLDDQAANQALGFRKTPEGYTWHHHQDGTTMQLVPSDIHSKTGHTGGFSLWK